MQNINSEEQVEEISLSKEVLKYHKLCNYEDNLDLLGPQRPRWLFQFELSLLIPVIMEQSLYQLLLFEFMQLEQLTQPSASDKKKLDSLVKESRSVAIASICSTFLNARKSLNLQEDSNFAARLDAQTIQNFVVKLIEESISKKIPTRAEKDKHISTVIALFEADNLAFKEDEQLAQITSFPVFSHLEHQLYSLAIQHFYHTSIEDLFEVAKDPIKLQNNQLILASRMIAGCLRNLLCLYFVQIEKQRELSKKKEVDLQFVQRDYSTILEHISYTISLAQIVQREKFHFQNKQLQKVEDEELQKMRTKIENWENVLQEEMSSFFEAYRWLENKTRKLMDSFGVSFESLTFLAFNRVNMVLLPKRQAQTFTKRSKTATDTEPETVEAYPNPIVRSHMELILQDQVVELTKLHTSQTAFKINQDAVVNPTIQNNVVKNLMGRKSFVEE